MARVPRIVAAVSTLSVSCLFLIGSLTLVLAQADIARMKSEYRRPPARPIENQALVDLGRALFFDPRISASGKTACVTCHFPELGWAVTERAAATIPASSHRAARNR